MGKQRDMGEGRNRISQTKVGIVWHFMGDASQFVFPCCVGRKVFSDEAILLKRRSGPLISNKAQLIKTIVEEFS